MEKRIRVNAKQTTKNLWYFDVTADVTTGEEPVEIDLISIINKQEQAFRADGKKLVSDEVD